MALIACPECNREVSDKAVSCVHCGYGIAQQPSAPVPAKPQLQILECPCCGAKVNLGARDCEYCGSHLLVLAEQQQVKCSKCQADLISGASFCEKCGSLQFSDERLRDLVKKEQFSQKKARESYLPEIQQQFSPDEFLHAVTYGPEEYYLLTDRRLYIAAIVTKGLIFKTHALGGLKKIVEIKDVTRTTGWVFGFVSGNMLLGGTNSRRIETFDGDINVVAYQSAINAPFFADSYAWGRVLECVLRARAEGRVSKEEALWRAKL